MVLTPTVIEAQYTGLTPEKELLLLQSKKAWSAFECSYPAAKANRSEEQARLFVFGIDQGRWFLTAADSPFSIFCQDP
jgi:hypothetical protein